MLTKPDTDFEAWELAGGATRIIATDIIRALAPDFDKRDVAEVVKDPYICPNEIPDHLCKKAPPCIVLTAEFDSYRYAGLEAAQKYRRNGNLLGCGVMKGCHHGHYFDYSHVRTDPWFKLHADICKKYLL